MIRLVNLATLTTNTKEQALQTILDLLNNMGNRKLAMHLVDLLIVSSAPCLWIVHVHSWLPLRFPLTFIKTIICILKSFKCGAAFRKLNMPCSAMKKPMTRQEILCYLFEMGLSDFIYIFIHINKQMTYSKFI